MTKKNGLASQKVLAAGMKHLLIVALLALWSFAAAAQTPVPETRSNVLSSHDQIKADRAREKTDEAKDKNGPRPWDRDVNGKRPWEEVPQSSPVGGLPKP